MGPWWLLEPLSPGACLYWCALMQQRGFGITTKCREGEELVSLLPVVPHHRSCQGRDPYCQRCVGTHCIDCNSHGLLAVVPISACGVAVNGAAKLVSKSVIGHGIMAGNILRFAKLPIANVRFDLKSKPDLQISKDLRSK
jgi:hypothetical protein